MPSVLLCSKHMSTLEEPEEQVSVCGKPYHALKYLQISKGKSGLIGIVEIGWESLEQAYLVHENHIYLGKKDQKILSVAEHSLNQFY